ncbi:MAG: RNA polymerase sigma factor [Ignavibacteria bacterium]|nr:RNA polymerase sigma factor [Ignavibacteria bacterium]
MEQELIEKLRSGDREAFTHLINEYQVMVRSITSKFAFAKEDAEDIAQTVFIEVFKGIHGFKGKSKLSTWIYQIAVSRCIDFQRSAARKKRIIRIKEYLSGKVVMPNALRDYKNNPEAVYSEDEKRRILYAAIDRLPENQRAAFLLTKVEGLSYQEVAETLHSTVPAVESLLHRAKQNLRQQLTGK